LSPTEIAIRSSWVVAGRFLMMARRAAAGRKEVVYPSSPGGRSPTTLPFGGEPSMNEPKPLDVYFNDHLAGSVMAIEIAKRCAAENAGTALGQFLQNFLAEVEEDKQTLEGLMDAVGASRNPVKQAGAWLGEKVTRLKLATSERDLATLLSVETLCMGVQGKIYLWSALGKVAADHEALSGMDFAALLKRAEAQQERLEQHRLASAQAALGARAAV
jgi:hypothetical protein